MLAIVSATLSTCTRERPLQPRPAVEPLVHEPLGNAEAEELAWLISGQVSAPPQLYERIKSDLQVIRERWGKDIPEVRDVHHRPHWTPRLTFEPEKFTWQSMASGAYHDWDSLNSLYNVMLYPWLDYPSVESKARVNPLRMQAGYERLPGVRIVYLDTNLLDTSNVFAIALGNGIGYLFKSYEWTTHLYTYFRSDDTSVTLVGGWSEYETMPSWWPEAKRAIALYRSGDDEYRHRDLIPPGRITDLGIVSLGSGDSLTVGFTTPGDEGCCEQASLHIIRWSDSLIGEDGWKPLAQRSALAAAMAPGTYAVVTVRGLLGDRPRYVAIRTWDGRGNLSPMAQVSTDKAP
jgi:hypothetical protein